MSAARLLSKMARGASDASIVICSDSTASTWTGQWPALLAEHLADTFPEWTVRHALWDDGYGAYGSSVTDHTGTGARNVTIWDASVAGKGLMHNIIRSDAQVSAKEPDLLIVSHGHNEGGTPRAARMAKLLDLVEWTRARCPQTGVVVIGQNPKTTGTEEAYTADLWAQACALRGWSFVDVHRAFSVEPGWQTSLMADTTHPNAAGHALWWDTMTPLFTQPSPTSSFTLEVPSSFATVGVQYLANGDFASFSPPTLTGWTAVNCSPAKDTTHLEGRNAYTVRLVASSAAATKIAQYVAHSTTSPHLLRSFADRWLTLAVRLRVANATSSATAGSIAISTGVGGDVASSGCGGHYDAWYWQVVSKRIEAGAGYLRADIFADGTANGVADVSVDRAVLTLGTLPRDCY